MWMRSIGWGVKSATGNTPWARGRRRTRRRNRGDGVRRDRTVLRGVGTGGRPGGPQQADDTMGLHLSSRARAADGRDAYGPHLPPGGESGRRRSAGRDPGRAIVGRGFGSLPRQLAVPATEDVSIGQIGVVRDEGFRKLSEAITLVSASEHVAGDAAGHRIEGPNLQQRLDRLHAGATGPLEKALSEVEARQSCIQASAGEEPRRRECDRRSFGGRRVAC